MHAPLSRTPTFFLPLPRRTYPLTTVAADMKPYRCALVVVTREATREPVVVSIGTLG
jgi:hypothetical protein